MKKTFKFQLSTINFGVQHGFTRQSFSKKNLVGFTLIELLIVIAILGILAAAVLVAINPGKRTKQARDAARKNDIGALATAVQSYYVTPGMGNYPASFMTLTASGDLKQIPTDPTNSTANYGFSTNTTEIAVWATLENPTSGSFPSWMWCYRSTTNKASEITAGSCTP